jgi:hypothetical protein
MKHKLWKNFKIQSCYKWSIKIILNKTGLTVSMETMTLLFFHLTSQVLNISSASNFCNNQVIQELVSKFLQHFFFIWWNGLKNFDLSGH